MSRDIESLLNDLKEEILLLDKYIISCSEKRAPLISSILSHIISSGGKRIRPVTTILCSRISKADANYNSIKIAAAIELIHNATLLHDDVVDDSDERRGVNTANFIWGNKASILVGDYMLSCAFDIATSHDSLEILSLLAKVSGEMSNGEVMQLIYSKDIKLSIDVYFDIIFSKTAALFGAAAKIGFLVSNASDNRKSYIYDFGVNLGMIFQMMDDVIDYYSKDEISGKKRGADFFERKVTLPVIILYSIVDKKDKSRLEFLFSDKARELKSQDDLNLMFLEVFDMMNKYDVLQKIDEKILVYKHKAKSALVDNFEKTKELESLLLLVDFASERSK